MNDYQRLERLKKYLDLSYPTMSKEIGLKGPQIFYDIKAEKCGISKDLASKIQDKFSQVNKTWLLTGEGEMLKDSTEMKSYTTNNNHQGVPYYDVDFVGGFDLIENDQTSNPTYHIEFPQYDKADCWVNITGHSMEPGISHGDIMALRKIEDWNTYILYGEVYAIVTDEYRTVKKIRRSKLGDDFLRIIPTNEEYDEQDIPKSVVLKVYQVLGVAKKLF